MMNNLVITNITYSHLFRERAWVDSFANSHLANFRSLSHPIRTFLVTTSNTFWKEWVILSWLVKLMPFLCHPYLSQFWPCTGTGCLSESFGFRVKKLEYEAILLHKERGTKSSLSAHFDVKVGWLLFVGIFREYECKSSFGCRISPQNLHRCKTLALLSSNSRKKISNWRPSSGEVDWEPLIHSS